MLRSGWLVKIFNNNKKTEKKEVGGGAMHLNWKTLGLRCQIRAVKMCSPDQNNKKKIKALK